MSAYREYLGEDGTQEYHVALAKLTALVEQLNIYALEQKFRCEFYVQRKVFSKTGKVGLYIRQEYLIKLSSRHWKPTVK